MLDALKDVFDVVAVFVIPLLVVFFPVYGLIRGVRVYEQFVVGAKEGFNIAVRIIPYLVAILFAIGMFRASGAMDALLNALRAPLSFIGFPPEVLPMALMRSLSGGGSVGVLGEMAETYGPDSLLTQMAATIFGSTETTFYVIAVYFGAVNIRKTRHALPAGLIADACAALIAVYVVRLLLG